VATLVFNARSVVGGTADFFVLHQIAMEYFDAGSLGDLLAIRKKGFNEYQIQMIIAQVLRGLQYLHSLNLIHRDIKVCIRFACRRCWWWWHFS
jgi:hypothetical protein